MGIRVSKDIGYFLSKKDIKKFLIPEYSDILDNDLKTKLKAHLTNYINQNNNDTEAIFIQFDLSDKKIDKIFPYQLISTIYNVDDQKGVLFRTPSLLEKARHDDDIDSYETPSFKYRAQFLHRPIFPVSGFIYKGGLPQKEEEFLVKFHKNNRFNQPNYSFGIGSLVDSQALSTILYMMYGKFDDKKFYKLLYQTGAFHPNIEHYIFLIAEAFGILKNGVDAFTFKTSLQPAIITSWG